jgi:hypothetical protein
VLVEARLLDDRPDMRERGCALLGHRLAEQRHRTGVGAREPEEHTDQGCLAGAVVTEEAERAAGGNSQVDVVHGYTLAEALCEPVRLDCKFVHCPAEATYVQ